MAQRYLCLVTRHGCSRITYKALGVQTLLAFLTRFPLTWAAKYPVLRIVWFCRASAPDGAPVGWYTLRCAPVEPGKEPRIQADFPFLFRKWDLFITIWQYLLHTRRQSLRGPFPRTVPWKTASISVGLSTQTKRLTLQGVSQQGGDSVVNTANESHDLRSLSRRSTACRAVTGRRLPVEYV